jgi:hypothetical protein
MRYEDLSRDVVKRNAFTQSDPTAIPRHPLPLRDQLVICIADYQVESSANRQPGGSPRRELRGRLRAARTFPRIAERLEQRRAIPLAAAISCPRNRSRLSRLCALTKSNGNDFCSVRWPPSSHPLVKIIFRSASDPAERILRLAATRGPMTRSRENAGRNGRCDGNQRLFRRDCARPQRL